MSGFWSSEAGSRRLFESGLTGSARAWGGEVLMSFLKRVGGG